MKTVTIDRTDGVVWPRECAKCGATRDIKFAMTTSGKINSMSPSLGGVRFQNEVLELRYPMCNSHALGESIADLVTRNTAPSKFLRGMFYLFALISLPVLLMLPLHLITLAAGKISSNMPVGVMFFALIPGLIGIAIFFLVRGRAVRAISHDDYALKLGFSNDAYANKFAQANDGLVN